MKITAGALLGIRAGRECPYCRNRLWFHPLGGGTTSCGRCGALPRHRRMIVFLRQTEIFTADQPLRLLHVAPEDCLRRELAALPHLDYVTGDLQDETVDLKRLDLTSIPFPDASFNVVICSHVLEHVPEDRRAMREMRRVLAPDGWALICGPTDPTRNETYEDARIVSPEERLAHFGQEDHVRIYSQPDFIARLEAAGFNVEVNPGVFTDAERRRYLIGGDSPVDQSYLCQAREATPRSARGTTAQ